VGGRKDTVHTLVTVSGELNNIHIAVQKPGRYEQYVPLHFPSIWPRNGVPSAPRVILVILRIPSQAVAGFSRGHGHPRPRRCSHVAHCRVEAQRVGGGGQSFSWRHNPVEEDNVAEKQQGVIETVDRLEVVYA